MTAQPEKLVAGQEARRIAFNLLDMEPPFTRQQLAQAFQRAMNQAAADEREACKRLVEDWKSDLDERDALVEAISERGAP